MLRIIESSTTIIIAEGLWKMGDAFTVLAQLGSRLTNGGDFDLKFHRVDMQVTFILTYRNVYKEYKVEVYS